MKTTPPFAYRLEVQTQTKYRKRLRYLILPKQETLQKDDNQKNPSASFQFRPQIFFNSSDLPPEQSRLKPIPTMPKQHFRDPVALLKRQVLTLWLHSCF